MSVQGRVWLGRVRTGAIALVIAVLVWVWAEGESLTTTTVPVRVVFPRDASLDVILIPEDPDWDGTVEVELEGATGAINEAVAGVPREVVLSAGQQGVPSEVGAGRSFNMRAALGAHPEMAPLSALISGAQPETVSVEVVEIREVEVPVRLLVPEGVALEGGALVEPGSVRVRLPASSAGRATASGVYASARLGGAALEEVRLPGEHRVSAEVRLPTALSTVEPVRVAPETVEVVLRVRARVDSLELASVPVWVSLPPTETSAWDVVVQDPFLTGVVVRGPRELIERVRSGEIPVKAQLELTSDDLALGVTSKRASVVGLPERLEVEVPDPTVGLEIRRRAGAQEGVGG